MATVVHLGDGLRGLGTFPGTGSRHSKKSRRGGAGGLDQWRARSGGLIERVHEESIREGAPEWLSERIEQARHLLRFMEDFARPLSCMDSARGGLKAASRSVA